MKRLTILLLLAGLAFSATGKTKPLITGHIKGLGNDTVIVRLDIGSAEDFFFKIAAKRGKFTFDHDIQERATITLYKKDLCYVSPNEDMIIHKGDIVLIVQPGENVSLTGEVTPRYIQYSVKGSPFNEEYSKYRETRREYDLALDSIMFYTYMFYNYPELVPEGLDVQNMERQNSQYTEKISLLALKYARENPDSEVSGYIASDINDDEFEEYDEILSDRVKNSWVAPRIAASRKAYEKIMAWHAEFNKTPEQRIADAKLTHGVAALDFTLKNADGKDFTLTDITDKYVVLDFWGSWCGFCIMGMPRMKEYYEKYGDKVEFVGIACNDTQEAWQAALAEHKPVGVQVIDEDGLVEKTYSPPGYPTKIILDNDKNIVKAFVGESDDFYNKLDELFR